MTKFSDLIIAENCQLIQALKKMDEQNKKLLIVSKDSKPISLISIGDIQRAILDGLALHSEVGLILRKDITVSHINDNMETIKATMLKFRTDFMPLVDDSKEIKDVIFWEDVFPAIERNSNSKLNLPVVVMAGGKGTRLQPITNIIPKPLVPIGDKPIIEIIVDRFVHMGASQFYFSVNYKADMIQYYFNQIKNRPYQIEYFTEDKPLGTAGSIHLLKDKIKETFFVSNCDILIDEDYREIYNYHKSKENELTIVAAIKHYSIPYGTIEFDEGGLLNKLTEKPDLNYFVNTGMYILEPHLIKEIPENEFFHITDLIEKIKNRGGRVGVFPVSEGAWKDIGEWDEYLKHSVKK